MINSIAQEQQRLIFVPFGDPRFVAVIADAKDRADAAQNRTNSFIPPSTYQMHPVNRELRVW
jgi:hypothetical protein